MPYKGDPQNRKHRIIFCLHFVNNKSALQRKVRNLPPNTWMSSTPFIFHSQNLIAADLTGLIGKLHFFIVFKRNASERMKPEVHCEEFLQRVI